VRVAGIESDMKTLAHSRDKEEIVSRLQKVHSDSPRLWGKMSAHQMVCHLADGFRLYMGFKAVGRASLPYPRIVLRCVALWIPFPWPHGFKTVPELDQEVGGTSPAEFASDVAELRTLIDRFTQEPRDYQWPSHPHFGRLSEREWLRLGYLHADHHLRQFGA